MNFFIKRFVPLFLLAGLSNIAQAVLWIKENDGRKMGAEKFEESIFLPPMFLPESSAMADANASSESPRWPRVDYPVLPENSRNWFLHRPLVPTSNQIVPLHFSHSPGFNCQTYPTDKEFDLWQVRKSSELDVYEQAEGSAPMTNGKKQILIVDDEPLICESLACLAQREGIVPLVAYDGESALKKIRLESPDVLLVDLKLPDMDGLEVLRRAKALDEDLPVVIITAFAEVHGAVEAMRAAAHDYLAKPFEHQEVIRVMHRALAERNLNLKLKDLSSHAHRPPNLLETMGPSDAIGRLIADVNRVAKSNFSVVITGETGTGKELVAQAIHQAGARAKAPFIPVDCGAIPETLLEGELFGHERGAFTGAVCQRAGKFETAKGGTLFLDEISNLPLGSQAKLLRVLQEKLVYRVGGSKPVEVEVRVLVASNEDLEAAVTSGSFRRDLFFRLNEFAIRIPPLRERPEDVLYLAKRFLDITNQELDKRVQGFSPPVIHVLLTYPWPGNVRQLRSTVRRAVLMAEEVVMEKHLDIIKGVNGFGMHAASTSVCAASGPPAATLTAPVTVAARPDNHQVPIPGVSLKEIVHSGTVVIERQALCQALQQAAGNKARAARLLQVDYKTIQSKIKKYGITLNERESYDEKEQGEPQRSAH